MKSKMLILIALSALFILCFGKNVFASSSYTFKVVYSDTDYYDLEVYDDAGSEVYAYLDGNTMYIVSVYTLKNDSPLHVKLMHNDDNNWHVNDYGIYEGKVCTQTYEYVKNANFKIFNAKTDADNYAETGDYDVSTLVNNPDGSVFDFSEDTATKNTDLGYLKIDNMSLLCDYIPNKLKEESAWRITWGEKSTTGFDLMQENVYIQVQSKMKYFIYNNIISKTIKKTIYPLPNDYVDINTVVSSLKKAEVNLDITSTSDSLYEQWNYLRGKIGLFDIGNYANDFRVRIIYKGDSGWTYGSWLTSTTKDSTSDYTTEDEEGNQEDTPTNVVNVDDDGNETVVDDGSDGGMTTFISVINSIKSSIGEVPKLIGEFFTFLPAQIVALIGAGFAVVIILRIIGR